MRWSALLTTYWAYMILVLTAEILIERGNGEISGWTLPEALQYCQQFEDLYQAITDDLQFWPDGIDRATMAASIKKFTTRGANKGIALAFLDGIAFVVEGTVSAETAVGHHASTFFTYMQVILEMQQLFGKLIPDVEFVIASSDRPMVSLQGPKPYLPVFRFCSSDVHADIMIPIFHFYSKKYTQTMLDSIPNITALYPWEQKKEILFGRFSHYLRIFDAHERIFRRLGGKGCTICKNSTNATTSCRVRQHFLHIAARYPEIMDVKSSPRLPMDKHAQYKYLLHLDGQALSSRIDLLLPLNSLIFKEESGYKTFYHHLLMPEKLLVPVPEAGAPQVHYLPVWKKSPDDILKAVEWAKGHDNEARRMAAAAQQFALRYLSKRARTCYWFRLLVEFSKLLKYKVSPRHEVEEEEIAKATALNASKKYRARPGTLGEWMTVEQYLNVVPAEFEGGKWRHGRIIEPF